MPLIEKQLIARIRAKASNRRGVVTGIGDDCAVLRIPRGHETLVTTDFSLEGIHFRRDWHSAESAGHRCLTRGLSDIASMGGEPLSAFLSLALPKSLPHAWVDGFMRGLLALANKYRVTLAGGDTARSPRGVMADIMVLGSIPAGKALLRSKARPGDLIYVTGELGASAAAIRGLRAKARPKLLARNFPRHFFPEPRVAVGKFLREHRLAAAMIDLSDGLSTDLAHICEESGVGAEVEAAAVPCATIGQPPEKVGLRLALHGGEDYELLFTAPASKKVPSEIAGIPVTPIGHILRGKQIFLLDKTRHLLIPQGWEHFRN